MSLPTVTWTLIPTTTTSGGGGGASTFTPGVDLEIDAVTGDLVVDSDAHFTTGLYAVAQGIHIRLLMFQGEWFLDLDTGIPYYQSLLGQKFNEITARDIFRTALLAAPGVVEIRDLSISFDGSNRHLTVDWNVGTTLGNIDGSLVI